MENNTIDMKRYINHLIDQEIDKPLETQDINLIREYSAYLDELEDNEIKIDTISELYLKNKAINIEKILNYEKEFNAKQQKQFKFKWKYLIVAAVIVSLFTIANMIAIANDYNLFGQIGAALFDFPVNESVNVDGFDVIYFGETREYSTIEEFMTGEGIESLLYPTYIPDGISFKNIDGSGEAGFLNFGFIYVDENSLEQTSDFTFALRQRPEFNEYEYFSEEDYDKYEYSGISFYIPKVNYDWYQVNFYYNEFYYNMTSYDYDILIQAIESINPIYIN